VRPFLPSAHFLVCGVSGFWVKHLFGRAPVSGARLLLCAPPHVPGLTLPLGCAPPVLLSDRFLVCGVSGFWVKHPSGSYSPVVRTPLVVRAAPCSGFWVKHPSGSYTPVVGTLLVVRAAWASRADARFVLRAPASLALICSCAARRVSGCSTFSVVLPCAFGFARRPVFRVRRTRGVVRPCCSEPNFSRAACRDVG